MSEINLWSFFTDPLLRAPTLGAMLMCAAAGLIGVLVFVRKRSLLGEALSHATYPGVTAAILLAGLFSLEDSLASLILVGAFCSAFLGFFVIKKMETRLRVPADAALTATLALFFGAGVTLASLVQHAYAPLYRQMQSYLYGQVATLTDRDLLLYLLLTLCLLLTLLIFYKEILTVSFDAAFATTTGVASRFVEILVSLLLVVALVMGVRCVGVVLVSAMLIAPPIAARQFTHHFSLLFLLSASFGALSGFLGVYLSVVLSQGIEDHYSLPTGPLIVLVGGLIAGYALLFAPERGLVVRYLRVARFRARCRQENLLKALWRCREEGQEVLTFQQIAHHQGGPHWLLGLLLFRLVWHKRLLKETSGYTLTPTGREEGARIVRLHRLWEAYLVYSLGMHVERVHKNAEEMEHILTPELEKQLTELLDHPQHDPHKQLIPP